MRALHPGNVLVEIYLIFEKSIPLSNAANDDVRPTNRVPTVRGTRSLDLATRGFVMPWEPQGKPLINAQAEAVNTERNWKKSLPGAPLPDPGERLLRGPEDQD